MDYCAGGTLLSMIQEEKLCGVPQILSLFNQITKGVKYLHDIGIAHGDIKPENIMLDARGQVKLIDFGYSKESRFGIDQDKAGTLYYAAPELMITGRYDTLYADIWAMGIVLYAMATRKLPYGAKDEREIQVIIIKHAFTLDPALDKKIEALFKEMTRAEPCERPTADQVLAKSIFTQRIRRQVSRQSITNLLFSSKIKPR
jgi:serine/threonine protein kinase